MSKGSSRLGATTTSTYIDLGADTPEGYSISSRSRELARRTVGDGGVEDRIRQRCSIAVGDFSMAELIRFRSSPVEAGLRALGRHAPIFTDIRMVQVGVQKKGHHSKVGCMLDYGAELSREKGITRTSAGLMELSSWLEGSIIVIGNAPSSLLVLCDMIKNGAMPALVVGCPVGFVNAAESKEELPEVGPAFDIHRRDEGRYPSGGGGHQRDHNHLLRGERGLRDPVTDIEYPEAWVKNAVTRRRWTWSERGLAVLTSTARCCEGVSPPGPRRRRRWQPP